MKTTTVKRELAAIGLTYPTVMGLMAKRWTAGGVTVGEHWAMLLQDLDPTHFENVCYEFATLRRPLPEQNDRLAFAIREEVCRRTAMDEGALEIYLESCRRELIKAGESKAREMSHEQIAKRWKEKNDQLA